MASIGMPPVWAAEQSRPMAACAAVPHAVHAPPHPPATQLMKPSAAAQPFLEAVPSNSPAARGGVAGPAGACLPSSPSSVGWPTGFGRKYRLGDVLGRGANATVRSAVDVAGGNNVAVKILAKSSVLASRTGRRSRVFSPRVIAEAREEGLTWSTVQTGPGSESIVQLLETFEDDEYIYFVSELCVGGSLETLMQERVMNEEEIARTFYHVLNAVNTCHSQHIFYGDIKPANFLVSDAHPNNGGAITVKMTDFGCACFAPEGARLFNNRVGTPLYKSPESFITSYDKKADLWGAGVILYQLVTGHLPFWRDWATVAASDERSVINTILHGEVIYDEREWQGRSAALKDLVTKLLTKNPDERISAAEALQHPFLASPC